MARRTLPADLTKLVHHVELSEAGWRDRAQELVAVASILDKGGRLGLDDLESTMNSKLPSPIAKAQVVHVAKRLIDSGLAVDPKDGSIRLTEMARRRFLEYERESNDLESRVESEFYKILAGLGFDRSLSWEHFSQNFVGPLVHELGAKTYELVSGETVTLEESTSHSRFLDDLPAIDRPIVSEAIMRFFDPNLEDVRAYVLTQLNAAFLIQAVGLSDALVSQLSKRTARQLRLRVIVDTNFLFSLIGLHENPADDVVKALNQIISTLQERVDIKLLVLPATLEEAQSTIASYESSLSGFYLTRNLARAVDAGTADLSGITLKFIEEGVRGPVRLTAEEYFEPYRMNLLGVCRDHGVDLLNESVSPLKADPDVDRDIEQRQKYEERTRQESRRKSYEKLLHDISLWHFVTAKRSSLVQSPLDAEFWVATLDFGLLGFDRYKAKQAKRSVPVCIHPTVLLQLLQLWIPRTKQLEAALVDSLRPLLPHVFDRSAEEVTIRILRTLGRFEGVENFSERTVSEILFDKAIRGRISSAPTIEAEIEVVRSALADAHEKLKAHAAQLAERGRELAREARESEVEVKQLRAELAETHAETEREVALLRQEFQESEDRRKELERRLGEMDRAAARRRGWLRASFVGAGCGFGGAILAYWVSAWLGLAEPSWLRWLAVGLLSVETFSVSSFVSARYQAILRNSTGARVLAQVSQVIGVVVILGVLVGLLVVAVDKFWL